MDDCDEVFMSHLHVEEIHIFALFPKKSLRDRMESGEARGSRAAKAKRSLGELISQTARTGGGRVLLAP